MWTVEYRPAHNYSHSRQQTPNGVGGLRHQATIQMTVSPEEDHCAIQTQRWAEEIANRVASHPSS
jgi:hypothetical protein